MSTKHKDSKVVKCPFFHAEESQKIYCEGVCAGTSIHLAFASKTEKKDYSGAYCNKHYKACRVYQMNDKKYDDCGNPLS